MISIRSMEQFRNLLCSYPRVISGPVRVNQVRLVHVYYINRIIDSIRAILDRKAVDLCKCWQHDPKSRGYGPG